VTLWLCIIPITFAVYCAYQTGLCSGAERALAQECDHILPITRGGDSEEANLVTACHVCNRSKRAKLIEEWKPDWIKPDFKQIANWPTERIEPSRLRSLVRKKTIAFKRNVAIFVPYDAEVDPCLPV
jgi:hypothetical protein